MKYYFKSTVLNMSTVRDLFKVTLEKCNVIRT